MFICIESENELNLVIIMILSILFVKLFVKKVPQARAEDGKSDAQYKV